MFEMPPKEKTIIPPKTGWKESSYYICDISFSDVNPIREYIFYTGFLNGKNKSPGGYNEIFRTNGLNIENVHYLKARNLIAGPDKYGKINYVEKQI